jgi:hypothetical protein
VQTAAGALSHRASAAPAQERRELREAAREFTDDALQALVSICKNGKTESARVAAANALLDRGYGKPAQTIDSTTRTQQGADLSGLSDVELERIARGSAGESESVH